MNSVEGEASGVPDAVLRSGISNSRAGAFDKKKTRRGMRNLSANAWAWAWVGRACFVSHALICVAVNCFVAICSGLTLRRFNAHVMISGLICARLALPMFDQQS